MDDLQWSDQHCHLDFGEWHFGSDMSKIECQLNADVCKFWCVCVDTDDQKINATYFLLLKPELCTPIESLNLIKHTHTHTNILSLFFVLFCFSVLCAFFVILF